MAAAIDILHAFNTVDRSAVLGADRTHFPTIAPWADLCYVGVVCQYSSLGCLTDVALPQESGVTREDVELGTQEMARKVDDALAKTPRFMDCWRRRTVLLEASATVHDSVAAYASQVALDLGCVLLTLTVHQRATRWRAKLSGEMLVVGFFQSRFQKHKGGLSKTLEEQVFVCAGRITHPCVFPEIIEVFFAGQDARIGFSGTEESIVTIDGHSDAGAAGCTKARHATFGGCLRVGQHTLATWSSTQRVWCH